MVIFDEVSGKVIGCAIEVHKVLGPGLLESAYEQCMARELALNGIPFKTQVSVPVEYKGINLSCGYRLDMIVKDTVIVELKSVDMILGIHEAQLLTYMKLSNVRIGLLINFNVQKLKQGIKRYVL
jgi:GxxExxY protein